MKELSVHEAAKILEDLVDQLPNTPHGFRITRGGEPQAVLISLDEYESLTETLDLLGDAEALADLNEAKGQGVEFTRAEDFQFRPQ